MPLAMHPGLRRLAALAALLTAATLAQAQVARVIEIRGASMVERAGQLPRLLGTGERLDQRDTIRVASNSWTVLEFSDQTRITLRPDTVFRIDAYSEGAPESVLMGLVKGGLRAVTGLIGKRNPRAFALATPLATIGIRGTEFDARLCQNDCQAEEQRPPPSAWPPIGVAARLSGVRGEVTARDVFGRARPLVTGSFIDTEEEIRTGPGGSTVLELRDGGRIALSPRTRFEIRRFVYDPARPAAAIAEFELRAGSIRAATGAIGKARPIGYRIFTKMGQIATRGTELIVNCAAGCESAPPKPAPVSLGNVAEVRLPNGVVLETRLKPDGTLGFFERPPPRGEPIGALPDGTPLFATAAPTTDGNLEWSFNADLGEFRNVTRSGGLTGVSDRIVVGAVAVRDGVMQVLSEPPFRENEVSARSTEGQQRGLVTVDGNGLVSPAGRPAPLDGSITLADGTQLTVGARDAVDVLGQLQTERAARLSASPPAAAAPAPAPTPTPTVPRLDNLREVRLPNGVVLDTRLKPDGTLGFFERLPPRGEPIGTLPDGTPLYATPAPTTDGNLEWSFDAANGEFRNRTNRPGELPGVSDRIAVGAVVMRDGVMQVLSEPPFLANEVSAAAEGGQQRGLVTVDGNGLVVPAGRAAPLDGAITLADGSAMAAGARVAADLLVQARDLSANALAAAPPPGPAAPAFPPVSATPAPPKPAPLGNVAEVRLPNGVVLETRLKPDGTLGFFERPPPRGEPIGTLPDGTPLYATPAPTTDGNLEWSFDAANGEFRNLTNRPGELPGSSDRLRVGAVVMRDGVMLVLSEPPFLANEVSASSERGQQRGLVTVDANGLVVPAGRAAPLDGAITLADGSRVTVGERNAVGLLEQVRTERAEVLAALQSLPPGDLRVTTVEGTAVVETAAGSSDVNAGQTGGVSPDGNVQTATTPASAVPGTALPPSGAAVPATPPADRTEPGLYTWVRDGAITLQKDGTILEVPTGSAALAGPTTLRLLAIVPNFLRLDPTPLPDPASLSRVSFFTTSGGAALNFCRVQ